MGSAATNGPLWSAAPDAWATIQEPFHRPLFAAMLEAAGVGKGTRVLDVGCGGGTSTAMAAALGADVVGLDAADGLIAHARRTVPGVPFHVGDMEHLPFGDDSFDVVFAANSIQYAENLAAALRELARVCKPAGRIVAGLWGPPEQVTYGVVFAAVRSVMPPPPPDAAPGGPFVLSGPGVLAGRFAEAGLRVTGSGDVNCPFEYVDAERHWQSTVGAGPTQALIAKVGQETVKSAIAAACATRATSDGRIRFDPNVFIYVVATR